MSSTKSQYINGHQPSVLQSHKWRTAENSAAYLLPFLKKDNVILDVGCGPGTISVDFAALVPEGRVIGIDYEPAVLEQARATAKARNVTNATFETGNVFALTYSDNEFDVVHAHQVLLHIADPVKALKEMRRVCKPGGIVAVRESDMGGWVIYPEIQGIPEWLQVFRATMKAGGGEPDAGRQIHVWARQAGFDPAQIRCSSSSWVYTGELRDWWGTMWSDRVLASPFAESATSSGLATPEDLQTYRKAWQQWAANIDSWMSLPSGEILCTK